MNCYNQPCFLTLTIGLSVLSFYLASWIHELGHAAGAVLTKIPLSSITLGSGPTIAQMYLFDVACKIKSLPGGNVRPRLTIVEYYRVALQNRIIYTSSGVVINIIAIMGSLLFVSASYHASLLSFVNSIFTPIPFGPITLLFHTIHASQSFNIFLPISIFILSNAIIAGTSLIPFVKSDGGNIIFCLLDTFNQSALPSFIKFSTMIKHIITICFISALIYDIFELYRVACLHKS